MKNLVGYQKGNCAGHAGWTKSHPCDDDSSFYYSENIDWEEVKMMAEGAKVAANIGRAPLAPVGVGINYYAFILPSQLRTLIIAKMSFFHKKIFSTAIFFWPTTHNQGGPIAYMLCFRRTRRLSFYPQKSMLD